MDDRVNPYAPPADETQAPPLVAEVVVDEAGWTIQYEIAVEDAVAWSVYLERISPTMRRQVLLARLMIGLAIITLSLLWMLVWEGGDGFAMGVVTIVVGGAFWALFPLLRRRQVRRLAAAIYRESGNYKVFGPRRVTLSDEYVISSSPLMQSIIRWHAIVNIHRTADALYLLITSVDALIIPRRAFASQAEFDRFAARARECFEGATRAS